MPLYKTKETGACRSQCEAPASYICALPTLSHLRGSHSHSPLGAAMLVGKIDVFLKITTAATIAQSFIEHLLCSKHVFVLCMYILFHITLNSLMYQKKSLMSKEIKSPTCLASPMHMWCVAITGSKSGQLPLVWANFQCYYFFYLFFSLSFFPFVILIHLSLLLVSFSVSLQNWICFFFIL